MGSAACVTRALLRRICCMPTPPGWARKYSSTSSQISSVIPTEAVWSTSSLLHNAQDCRNTEVISLEELRKVAKLACLSPSAQMEDKLREDFQRVLTFVKSMKGLPTEGVDVMWSSLPPSHTPTLRPDRIPDAGSSEHNDMSKTVTSESGMTVLHRVGADAGSVGMETVLEGAPDAAPPYFTAPKAMVASLKS